MRGSVVKPSFVQQSTAKDIVDPIYDANDPITKSINKRSAEGSFMSVIKEKKEHFFYTLSLTGSGCNIPVSPNKSAKAVRAKASASPIKNKKSLKFDF